VFDQAGGILLLKRPERVHCGGLWALPGGKIEAGELPLAAARRELREETELKGMAWRKIGEHTHAYLDRELHFFLFACDCESSGSPSCHSQAEWVMPEAMACLPMPEANQVLTRMLLECR
jgi:8-oxo-dGTP diphosphatase